MKRWSRKEQKNKLDKRERKIFKEIKHQQKKDVFYLNILSAAENAACTDAINVSEYKDTEDN